MQLPAAERAVIERRVLAALRHDQRVVHEILVCHVPRLLGVVTASADAEALALAYRVVHQAVVLPERLAVDAAHDPRLRRQVAAQEVAEAPLADEADAGAVLLGGDREGVLAGDAPHLGLGQFADREQALGQLFAGHRVQEVALVLAGIETLQQPRLAVGERHARVVPCRDARRTQRLGILDEDLELDLAVAQHVGVRRAPGAVFGQEVLEHVVPVLGGEIGRVQADAEQRAHRLGVGEIGPGGAVLGAVVLVPVLHEQALDRVALLAQQQRGNRRIDAARGADDDALAPAHEAWG